MRIAGLLKFPVPAACSTLLPNTTSAVHGAVHETTSEHMDEILDFFEAHATDSSAPVRPDHPSVAGGMAISQHSRNAHMHADDSSRRSHRRMRWTRT